MQRRKGYYLNALDREEEPSCKTAQFLYRHRNKVWWVHFQNIYPLQLIQDKFSLYYILVLRGYSWFGEQTIVTQ